MAKRPDKPVSVPIIEETASVAKQAKVRARVEISKSVESVEEVLRPELMSEEVEIERVPVGRLVKVAPKPRQQGDTFIIPVVEEELVVMKRLVLKEEIHIRKSQRIEPEEHRVTLRKESVRIERHDAEQS